MPSVSASPPSIAGRMGKQTHQNLLSGNLNNFAININEYGRFDELKATVDKAKAKAYFDALEDQAIPLFKVNIKTANLLQDFIIQGGFVLEFPTG